MIREERAHRDQMIREEKARKQQRREHTHYCFALATGVLLVVIGGYTLGEGKEWPSVMGYAGVITVGVIALVIGPIMCLTVFCLFIKKSTQLRSNINVSVCFLENTKTCGWLKLTDPSTDNGSNAGFAMNTTFGGTNTLACFW